MFYSFCINIYLFTSTYIYLHQYTFVCSCPLWVTVLKSCTNCSHDSCFTSECKQSKRFKLALGLWRYVNCLDQPINIQFDHVLELLLSVLTIWPCSIACSRLKFRWVYGLSSNESWFIQGLYIKSILCCSSVFRINSNEILRWKFACSW